MSKFDLPVRLDGPTEFVRQFKTIAKRYGIAEYATVLNLGMKDLNRLRNDPVFHRPFLDALAKSPEGIARLLQFVHGRSKRPRQSIVQLIEENPEMINWTAKQIEERFPGARRGDNAVEMAKRTVLERNGIKVKTGSKRGRPRNDAGNKKPPAR